jgi:hypothetical protein
MMAVRQNAYDYKTDALLRFSLSTSRAARTSLVIRNDAVSKE